MSEVVRRVRAYVLDNFLLDSAEEELGDDDSFLDDGIVDSTGMLELVTWIQEAFGIEMSDAELIPDNLDSVHKVAAFVASKTAKPPGPAAPGP